MVTRPSKWVLIFLHEIRNKETLKSWTNGGLLTWLILYKNCLTQELSRSRARDTTMCGKTFFKILTFTNIQVFC